MRILSLGALTALALVAASPVMAQPSTDSGKAPATKMAPSTKMAPASKPAETKMAPAKTTGAASHEQIDINTATQAQLEGLPGIGKAHSEAIIKGRPYRAKNELVDKKILTKGVYDHVKDRIIAKQS
jgi:DNA uptake protein ComE-like DNA-binding protein